MPQGPSLRHLRQQGPREPWAHAGNTLEDRRSGLASSTPLDHVCQVVIEARQLPFQPRYVLLHGLVQTRGHRPEPIPLRRQHVDHLATSEEYSA